MSYFVELTDGSIEELKKQIENKLKNILKDTVTISFHDFDKTINIIIWNGEGFKKDIVAEFKISSFPGCCGMCVSNNTIVYKKYINRGLGSALIPIKIDIAKFLSFSRIVTTVVENNLVEKHILVKAGWKKFENNFVNVKTDNEISIYYYDIEYNDNEINKIKKEVYVK